MFEQFPYTDMHQLNLDWIIKIAKDFLDQYTHIQQLIEDGETSLQNLTDSGLQQLQDKADNLEGLLQAWYNEHSEDIANQLTSALDDLNTWYNEHSEDISGQLASALADLNDWYTIHQNYLDQTLQTKTAAFNSSADAKALQTLESIPDDYTELANEVGLHDTIINGLYQDETFYTLTKSSPIDGYCSSNKYWGYKIPYTKMTLIKSVEFASSQPSLSIDLFIAEEQTGGLKIIHTFPTASWDSTHRVITLDYILPHDNCYLIFNADQNAVGYTGSGSGDGTLYAYSRSGSDLTVIESHDTWGLDLIMKTQLPIFYDEVNTFGLATTNVGAGGLQSNKNWALPLFLPKNTVLRELAFPVGGAGTVVFELAYRDNDNLIPYYSIKSVTYADTGSKIVKTNAKISYENTYLIVKPTAGNMIAYTAANTGKGLYSATYADNIYTIVESLTTRGIVMDISYVYEPIHIYNEMFRKNLLLGTTVTVSKDGTKDFTTITEALKYLAANHAGNNCTILIYPGEYNEYLLLGAESRISLVGINRDTCIIKDTSGRYVRAPIRMEGNGYIANLTVISTHTGTANYVVNNVLQYNPSYAIHCDDRHDDNNNEYVLTIQNCRVYCEQNPAIGIGLDKNQTINIFDCEIETKETADMLAVVSGAEGTWGYKPEGGAIFYHALYSGHYTDDSGYQKLVVKNCIIRSNIPNVVAGESGGMMNQVITTFVGNSGYSSANGRVWYNPLTGATLDPISSGNNITAMNAE